ncbi:MAG: NYN domain-containing protein [Duganella sp.]
MASSNDNVSMALFCDFENVALGVRDANYDKFDIKPVLERLLLKGSIVVKKAYCDWDRYKGFKAPMHEANFELIEIPHVRQSGKNSADIRMVVDALDLCYTKSHVDTFVIISGDSDFSPLVSKLRENAKKVIGVGVKQSTSDLLVANCDEFIFYDDLVRESRRARRDAGEAKPAVKRSPEEERARREEMEKRRDQAVEIAINTFEALVLERGDSGKIWASVLKEAIKRRKPDFSESYYGFRTFGNLIEECKARGLLEFGRDEKSGAYVYRGNGVPNGAAAAAAEGQSDHAAHGAQDQESRRSRNRGRTAAERFAERQAERHARQGRNGQPHENAAAVEGAAATVASESSEASAEALPAIEVVVAGEAAPVTPVTPPVESGRQRERERGRNRGGRDRHERAAAAQETSALPAAVESGVAAAPEIAASVPPAVIHDAPAAPAVPEAQAADGGAAATAAPVKKKNGPKPPARKLKAAAKAPADAAPAKPGKGAKGGQARDAGAAQAVVAAEAAAPLVDAPVITPVIETTSASLESTTESKPAKPARKPSTRAPRAPKPKAPKVPKAPAADE